MGEQEVFRLGAPRRQHGIVGLVPVADVIDQAHVPGPLRLHRRGVDGLPDAPPARDGRHHLVDDGLTDALHHLAVRFGDVICGVGVGGRLVLVALAELWLHAHLVEHALQEGDGHLDALDGQHAGGLHPDLLGGNRHAVRAETVQQFAEGLGPGHGLLLRAELLDEPGHLLGVRDGQLGGSGVHDEAEHAFVVGRRSEVFPQRGQRGAVDQLDGLERVARLGDQHPPSQVEFEHDRLVADDLAEKVLEAHASTLRGQFNAG